MVGWFDETNWKSIFQGRKQRNIIARSKARDILLERDILLVDMRNGSLDEMISHASISTARDHASFGSIVSPRT